LTPSDDAFGEFTRPELASFAGLLTYVEITQVGKAPLLRPPRKESAGSLLIIDAATRSNLELMRSNQGAHGGSLLAAIDRTVTAAGARELASRLASPLTDVVAPTRASIQSLILPTSRGYVRRYARSSRPRPISPVLSPGLPWGAVARAISAPCATRFTQQMPLPKT
jgi:hypothetical protein